MFGILKEVISIGRKKEKYINVFLYGPWDRNYINIRVLNLYQESTMKITNSIM